MQQADDLTAPLETGKPYLGRLQDVADLLADLLYRSGDLLAAADQGNITLRERDQGLRDLAAILAGCFAGLDEHVSPIGPWNGAPLARSLLMAEDDAFFARTDRNNPQSIIATVLEDFVREACLELRSFQRGEEDIDRFEERVNNQIRSLAYRLLGLPIQPTQNL